MKRHTAKNILQSIAENKQESRRESMLGIFERTGRRNAHNERYQFWQQGNHPIELYSNDLRQQRLHYLRYNPVVAGFVNEPEHFSYTNAELTRVKAVCLTSS